MHKLKGKFAHTGCRERLWRKTIKMLESPKNLEELCLEAVCKNLLYYVNETVLEKVDQNGYEEEENFYTFRDPELFLINSISEKLLAKLAEEKMLCDAILHLFSSKHTQLKKVTLAGCTGDITKSGLPFLKQHNITEIHCSNFCQISLLLDNLNNWSLNNMRKATFNNCSFFGMTLRNTLMVRVTLLKNLRVLVLSYSELNQVTFSMMCEDLTELETLDISGTMVKNLDPLVRLQHKLKNLSICDLVCVQNVVPTLEKLTQLKHLDISLNKNRISTNHPIKEILKIDGLYELCSIDFSGWKDQICREELLAFIEQRPKLEFLGLVLTDVNFDRAFSEDNTWPQIVIAGLVNEDQIKITLRKYVDRALYVQKALYNLFQMTSYFQEARPDIFRLVLPVMENHQRRFGVQVAATACLYNLTRNELSKKIHPSALSKGVELTLSAMERYPEEFQLQKNSLLSLCSDRILQEVTFDKFRCSKLVLNALCLFDDVNMNRMAVAICSILAAKISTEETSLLGSDPFYMKKLLSMVQSRVESREADITLKFTLSALWNLTDESEKTCKVFLNQKGSELFLQVLKAFKGEATVETKVLGLLNNVAEVASLRGCLMMDELFQELYDLLGSENIDVAYFSAGIIAHLASVGTESWKVQCYSRLEMLEKLEKAVMGWKVPECEMVSYRSFKPFFPLLKKGMDYQVQLWAVWAIHLVCTKSPEKYCNMLKEEEGYKCLKELIDCQHTHPHIREVSDRIISLL